MDFCKKCGGLVVMKEGQARCAGCNAKAEKKTKLATSEKILRHDAIKVVNESDENTNPIVEMTCPECKTKKCYFWTQQTRSSDESETKFYQCTNPKCKHTWRKYR